MLLYFVRHWETYENKQWILQWHYDWKLNEEWIEQAQKISERLALNNIEMIFSSQLSRALDTANIIAIHHPTAKLLVNDLFQERSFWILEAKKKDETIRQWIAPSFFERAHQQLWSESNKDAYERAKKILDNIASYEQTVNIALLVSHWWIWKQIHAHIMNIPFDEVPNWDLKLKNTSLSIFEYKWWVRKDILINNAEHLEHSTFYWDQ